MKKYKNICICFGMLLMNNFVGAQQKINKNFYEVKQQMINMLQDSSVQDIDGERNQLERWAHFNESRGITNDNSAIASQIMWQAKKSAQANSKKTRADASNWQCLGPKQTLCENTKMQHAGRVNCIAEHPTMPNVLFAGAPDGGLWKSIDSGATWMPITDMLYNISIADIVINPTQPNIMYLATGDGFGYDAVGNFWGGTYSMGVLKTNDGGITWDTTGLSFLWPNKIIIRDLEINKNNPNELFASTSKGFYKSIDAGNNWIKLFAGNAFEVKYAPSDSMVLYAVSDSVQKSMDGGLSWVNISSNIVMNSSGAYRNNIAISSSNPNKIYVLNGSNTNPSLFASNDGGINWDSKANPLSNFYYCFGYYAACIAVNPVNEDNVLIGSYKMFESLNGGDNFVEAVQYAHPDNHSIVFSKYQNGMYFICNDAGIYTVKNDDANMISELMSIAQIYNVGINPEDNDNVFVGFQDGGTRFLKGGKWYDYDLGGDGMEIVVDMFDANKVYASIQNGAIFESFNGGYSSNWGAQYIQNSSWNTPLAQDLITGNIYQAGLSEIFDFNSQASIPLPIGTYIGLYQSSKFKKRVIANTVNRVVLSKNGFQSPFNNIRNNLSSFTGMLKNVAVSEVDSNKCYAIYSAFAKGNKVFQTNNNGTTWINISGSLPNVPVNCILPINNAVESIYIGTDIGVYYRDNNMTDWEAFDNNMPKVIITELAVGELNNKLYATTYGRGLWISNLQAIQFPATIINKNIIETNITYQPYLADIYIRNKTGIKSVSILSISGASLVNDVSNTNITNKNININTLANGIYIVQVIDANNNKASKLISKNN